MSTHGVRSADLPDYDRFVAGHLEDPFPLYRALRERDPVHWSPELDSWVLTRYRDVQAVSQFDPHISSDRIDRLLRPLGPTAPNDFQALHDHLRSWVVFTDPPAHSGLRNTVKRDLAPAAVADLGPRIGLIVATLLDRLEGQEQPDLIRDVAFPLPAMVVSELLGVPTDDLQRLHGWSDRIMRFFENVEDDMLAVTADADLAVRELVQHLEPLVESRRQHPEGDLISSMVKLVDEGTLTVTQLYGWCLLLLVAGHETTTGLIGNAVVTMLQHPDVAERLRVDASSIDSAIEEVMRFESPVDRQTRAVITDTEIGGRQIAAGSRVYALLAAANRDPEVFVEPDTFDIDRSPNRHLGFGYGIHFCLGAYLARLEARIVVLEVLRRYPRLSIVGTPSRWHGQTMRRYESARLNLGLTS